MRGLSDSLPATYPAGALALPVRPFMPLPRWKNDLRFLSGSRSAEGFALLSGRLAGDARGHPCPSWVFSFFGSFPFRIEPLFAGSPRVGFPTIAYLDPVRKGWRSALLRLCVFSLDAGSRSFGGSTHPGAGPTRAEGFFAPISRRLRAAQGQFGPLQLRIRPLPVSFLVAFPVRFKYLHVRKKG